MAFDFPPSPSVGQVYAPTGGPSFTYNGVGWLANPPSIVGWRPVGRLQTTVDVGFITMAIPNDVRDLRLSGHYKTNSAGWAGGIQFSIDGGATFKATGQYVAAQLYYAGGAAGGYVNQDFMRIAGVTNNVFYSRKAVNCHLTLPTPTEGSLAVALLDDWSGGGYNLAISAFAMASSFSGTATHVRLVSQTGNVGGGTNILVEGL